MCRRRFLGIFMKDYILILGKEISWYSILGMIGLVAAVILCIRRKKKYDFQTDDLINLAGYAIVGGILGAKALALLCMTPQFIQYWEKIVWNEEFLRVILGNGFVYYGGFLGVLAAFFFYCRQYRLNYSRLLELIAPTIPLFHGFGRIGCYIAGCCGGIDGFPLQLVESAINFCLVPVLLWAEKQPALKGRGFLLYLLFYGSARFILEFFRGDPERGFLWIFSVSQWISAVLILAAIFLWSRVGKEERLPSD